MIRPYREPDKEILLEIFKMNVPEYFDIAEAEEFSKYLENFSRTYLIIETGNKIIGGVGYEFRENDRSGRINWIFLHPEFSHSGYGKEAVDHCLRILRSNHDVKILIVRTSQHAYKFFEKSGFELVSTEKDYWGQGLDLYLMTQPVN
jgi:ribosomal protein S18 acetylase RimI-like enzyme